MFSKSEWITKRVADLVEPIVGEMDLELVDVEYLSKSGTWVLRLYIDKTGGVTIDDCVRVSGEIGHVIDGEGILEHPYTLEVSSPGLNRPLKKERDFIWARGKRVKVKMAFPIEGRRNFTGYLKDFHDGMLYLETEGAVVTLPRAQVEKANLVYDFNH